MSIWKTQTCSWEGRIKKIIQDNNGMMPSRLYIVGMLYWLLLSIIFFFNFHYKREQTEKNFSHLQKKWLHSSYIVYNFNSSYNYCELCPQVSCFILRKILRYPLCSKYIHFILEYLCSTYIWRQIRNETRLPHMVYMLFVRN